MTLNFPYGSDQFVRQVEEESGQRVADCYQCGKCTAGCPSAFAMDYGPSVIMRAVQLGMRERALTSNSIWVCAACETCTARCPQGVDVAGVLDALRRIAYAEGIKSPACDAPLFHRIFLGNVQQFGRVFEMGLMGLFNVASGHFLKDVLMAPMLLRKGKLNLLPPRVGDVKTLKEMFARARELEARAK